MRERGREKERKKKRKREKGEGSCSEYRHSLVRDTLMLKRERERVEEASEGRGVPLSEKYSSPPSVGGRGSPSPCAVSSAEFLFLYLMRVRTSDLLLREPRSSVLSVCDQQHGAQVPVQPAQSPGPACQDVHVWFSCHNIGRPGKQAHTVQYRDIWSVYFSVGVSARGHGNSAYVHSLVFLQCIADQCVWGMKDEVGRWLWMCVL